MIVSRTCTEISSGDAEQRQDEASKPLEDFRDAPAYVLLGDPGAGKTTAFGAECEALGEQACPITARDFLTFDPHAHPEWLGKTLFIDGLDEVRAGSPDARTPFDQIRRNLDALGKPSFRLSCREADWLGANDQSHLKSVSRDAKVTVLRLDPLTDLNIEELLQDHPDVDVNDSEAFFAEASERGIGDLLRNPQTLDLLAKAVSRGGGRWPGSRTETFEMACEQMVSEPNLEHLAASASSDSPELAQLLDAAGRVCAVQLVAGLAGYTRPHGQSDENYPALGLISDGHYPTKVLNAASATRLFTVADNRFSPVHRHIAEFLGARYLAQVIDRGLPARRAIALMTGLDGTVVTELRGLSGWLAAHCEAARANLIEQDPVSIGLYGDIGEFSLDEKGALLESLKRHPSRLDSVWPYTAFGPIAKRDMQPTLKKVLEDGNRDQDHQTFTGFVLRVLQCGDPIPSLFRILLQIVRDDTRQPSINHAALYSFIHNCPDGQDKSDKLRALLVDIHGGSVSDPDNKLLGTLLNQLYPHEITPMEVWDYLSETRDRERFYRGQYEGFWNAGLLAKSSDKQVAELLDGLPRRHAGLRSHSLEKIPLELLIRGLKTYGDQHATDRLYDWLGVGEIEEGYWGRHKSTLEIRSWLEERPDLQKALILEGLSRCPESGEIRSHAFRIYKRFYRAERPPDFGLWCLEQAVGRANTQPRIAEYLFDEAFRRRERAGLTLDILRQRARKSVTLTARLDQLIARQEREEHEELKCHESLRTFTEERRQEEEKWLAHVRANETALRENRGDPALLHRMAEVYFESPEDALRDERLFVISPELRRSELQCLRGDGAGLKGLEVFLGGDSQLVDAVVQGLLGTIDRKGVPDVEEIFDLMAKNLRHFLGWPYLAALEEIERTAPEEDPPRWDDSQIRKALAFYHCDPPTDDPPEWYLRLLETRPETVADVQVQFAIGELRRGREHVFKLAKLADDPAYVQVANHASLPLLRAFPTRCKLKQLESLEDLLWAAIQHADRASLRELIERKLSRTSMNDTQRVLWLAAGFAIEPEAYQLSLMDFVEGHERRSRHLAEFFEQRGRRAPSTWLEGLGISASAQLIHIIGSYVGPDLRNGQGWITPSMRASRLVDGLIQQNLASSSDKAASSALASLIEDPGLYPWRDLLFQAQEAQRVIRRDADFHHPTIEQVCQSLNGGTPANAGDLAALVVDQLRELAEVIRKDNTNAWRQYWNVNQYYRAENPRPENSCRDTVLSYLRQCLPRGVDAQPEGQYASNNRADIRVSCGGFQVPVEIKRNANGDLWRGLRNQLIGQYTNDPDTDGYGIYLVFWFGEVVGQRTPLPPSPFRRPANAEKLEQQLRATLSEAEARKISVCVIDVSRS